MLLLLFAIIDILSGAILLAPEMMGGLAIALGSIMAVKATYSIVTAALGGFFFDFLGWIDIVVALSLLYGIGIDFLWVLIALKGVWSLTMAIRQ